MYICDLFSTENIIFYNFIVSESKVEEKCANMHQDFTFVNNFTVVWLPCFATGLSHCRL